MYMNGAAIFHFAISVVPKAIASLLAKLNLTVDQVDCFLFHQANRYMLDYLVKKLKIPVEKTIFLSEHRQHEWLDCAHGSVRGDSAWEGEARIARAADRIRKRAILGRNGLTLGAGRQASESATQRGKLCRVLMNGLPAVFDETNSRSKKPGPLANSWKVSTARRKYVRPRNDLPAGPPLSPPRFGRVFWKKMPPRP